ncbi:tetratricopeptide repeat protein [Pleomorphovibrio marinus]|uniref:tetratricopeptide repeat protein n=1 Tax=Pleomorphovibrio marinus TaxID=2164132 RepID=UPI000E0A539A|nr:tetratricopeptide repeat protein [Pleomorphovibrio marinus]
MIVLNISTTCKIFFLLFLLSSCSVRQFIKKAENQKISVNPPVLKRQGQEVNFELVVLLPRQAITKDVVYTLFPEFHYANNRIYIFDETLTFKGEDENPAVAPQDKLTLSMPYREGMEKGELKVYGVATDRNGRFRKSSKKATVSTGIINTQSLAMLGESYEEGSIPKWGLEVPHDQNQLFGMYHGGWQELKNAIMRYSGVSFEEKSAFLKILEGKGDYYYKEKRLKALPQYDKIAREVFGRVSTFRVGVGQRGMSDQEISVMANHILTNNASPQTLPEAELAFAAMEEPRLQERSRLFEGLVKAYPSVFAWNNYGVTLLNLAERTASTSDKNRYLGLARHAFNEANSIFPNPYASYNYALILMIFGDYSGAYEEFYKSMYLTENADLRKKHEAKLGAVSIHTGDYRLGIIHLDKSFADEITLFNKGLAYLLAEDYLNSLVNFEEAALMNMENGYPFYGLALIAARNGEVDKLGEYLGKATEKSEKLRLRAVEDLEFKVYRESEAFKMALK